MGVAQLPTVLMQTCCAVQVQVWCICARSEVEVKSKAGGTLLMDEFFRMSRSLGPRIGMQPPLSAVALWSTSSPAETLFLALGDTWGGVEVVELRLIRGALVAAPCAPVHSLYAAGSTSLGSLCYLLQKDAKGL